MPEFAQRELREMVKDLAADPAVTAGAPDLVAALILAARRLPIQTVASLMPAFEQREAEELGKGGSGTP